MFFSFNSIGRFFMHQQSQLDGIIQSPDCTLEKILDADNILPELKGMGATKFAEFIVAEPGMYMQMLNYIVNFEDELINHKTQIQYPFLISELLSVDNPKLIDFLFEDTEKFLENEELQKEQIRLDLLPRLLNFLDQDTLNPTSAGYFNKVIIPIIRKRGYNIWQILSDNPHVLQNLIKHLDSRHIAEVIEKLILLETQQETQETYLNERQLLLERIIKYMHQKQHVRDIVDNVSEILCEITSKSMGSLFYHNNEIIHFIEQIRNPELLFSIALKTQNASTYQILINLVELMSKEQSKQDDDEVIHNDGQDKDYSGFYRIISELPQGLLQQDIFIHDFQNSNREQISPFGLGRMKLLRLIVVLMQANDENINKLLAENMLFEILFTIAIKYHSNNQIHLHLEQVIKLVFDGSNLELMQKLTQQSKILQFIVVNSTKEKKKLEFTGFLTKIANYLIEKSFDCQILRNAMSSDDNWNVYADGILSAINLNEKQYLCGINPRQKNNQVEQDDDINVDNAVLEILKKFNPAQNDPNEEHEVITEEIQLSEEVLAEQVEKEEEIEDYLVNRFWKPQLHDEFSDTVLKAYK